MSISSQLVPARVGLRPVREHVPVGGNLEIFQPNHPLTHSYSEFLSGKYRLLLSYFSKLLGNEMKVDKIYEGNLLFGFRLRFLLQIFFKKYFCWKNIIKIVRPQLRITQCQQGWVLGQYIYARSSGRQSGKSTNPIIP